MSIDHNILYSILENLILKQNRSYQWKKEVLWLAKVIIFSKPTENYILKGDLNLFKFIPKRKLLFYSGVRKGLPIGNYSSQFFANLYLNELDQFIKRKLKCKYYIRYVDDFILLDRDKEKLKLWRNEINNFLRDNLKLKLSLEKTKIQPIKAGIDFLGYFVKPDYILVRRKVVSRLKNKLYRLNETKKEIPVKKILATINSYYGHFRHAFSFNLRKDICENHLGNFKKQFLPKPNYLSLKISSRFLLFCCIFGFFLATFGFFADKADAQTYYASSTLVSKNLLEGLTVNSIDYFGYFATTTATSTIKVQFSQDKNYWYNASGTLDGWTTLSDGNHLATSTAISLTNLSWFGSNFYYRMQFETTATSQTPVLDEIKLWYNLGTQSIVSTLTPTNIATSSISANGNISEAGATKRGFQYGLTQTPTWEVSEEGSFGAGDYSLDLTGLLSNKTYYLRAFAENSWGTAYGDWMTFTTNPYYYTSGTLVSKNILAGQGAVSIDYFYSSSTVPAGTSLWVQFSQDKTNWYAADGTSNGTTTIPDGQATTSLAALGWSGSNFYYKMQFNSNSPNKDTTPVLDEVKVYFSPGPSVSTLTPIDITPNSVTGQGEIIALTGGSATVRGFQYGLTETPTWSVSETGDFTTGTYSLPITGLSPNTTYYIRAFATNLEGTGYGDWVSFDTPSYYTIGYLVSKNILTGIDDVVIINNFFTSSTIPSNTHLWVQFATSSTAGPWYSAEGLANGWSFVPNGQAKFILDQMEWSGSNFYYKMKFETEVEGQSPVLDEIALDFNLFHSPEIKGSIRIKGGTILK